MRLYLSSFRVGNKLEELHRLMGEGRRTALIGNSMDFLDELQRAKSISDEIARLKDVNLEVEEIDLRNYFNKSDELREVISGFNLIWVRGGNTFILRRAYKQSGFDELLKELLENDTLVYGGYSAGICVLTPSLRGLEIVDDPNAVPDRYNSDVIWDGLGVLPYSIAPHYRSDHPESAAIEKSVEYFRAHNMPFKTLRDGESIVVDQNGERIVG